MPCIRCDARQSDPVRGASPWKRRVLRGRQVLVCPSCQAEPEWTAGFDQCPSCGSTELVRALSVTTCRSCGHQLAETGDAAAPPPRNETAPGLSSEVEEALRRLLGPTSEGSRGGYR